MQEVIFIYVFYMDLFLVQNFLINLIILSLTSVFWKYSVKWMVLRMMASCLLGSALSTFCLIALHSYRGTMAVMAFFIVPLMLFLSFGWPGPRQFVFCVATSLLSAVILNGTVCAFSNLTGIRNLNLYICGAAFPVAWFLVKSLRSSISQQRNRLSVILTGPGGRVSCLGLYDSGNLLTVPKTEEPVHIIAPELLKQLSGEAGTGKMREEVVAFHTLGTQNGQMRVYQIPALEVEMGKSRYRVEPVWVGCGDAGLMRGKNYQIILNAAIIDSLGKRRASQLATLNSRK